MSNYKKPSNKKTKVTNNIEKAIEIALKEHTGQKEKAGAPYIFHCLRIMLKGKTKEEQIAGVLHDTVEDTKITFDDLRAAGFSDDIIEAVDCLTKRKYEQYENYISRVLSNKIAIKVKLHDLEDNMNLLRLKEIKEKDIKRLNKYIDTYNKIKY